eukprot:TRINITY_DN6846_c0_g1_i1.p1 TRINITY_DN6846_c0_g1~~TRINITY_DN6846_c0_g1_i1.p1  ORF type:complete len:421 (-),score=60.97 TRINITY_DN6846_c0_g1_i1:153-1415(-)
MIHSIFILSRTGDVIIEKHYRGTLPRTIAEQFFELVRKASKPEEVLPVLSVSKHYLVHVQRGAVNDGPIYFLAVVSHDVPVLLVIEALHRIADTFEQQYFNGVLMSEGLLRENFLYVYQLLEEMLDFGIPFTTEPNALVEIIPPPNVFKKFSSGLTGDSQMSGNVGDGVTNTPWRKTGVRYATNEIYFDIVEEIDTTVEPNGIPIAIEVSGKIMSLSKLSGMPDLTMSFNQPSLLDDVSFHPCVRYNRWEQNKVVSFVPPDGSFELMSYRVKGQGLQLPIYVKPQITYSAHGGRVCVTVGSKLSRQPVEETIITIPFPKSVGSATLTANIGNVAYDDKEKVATWRIGKVPKDKNPQLDGSVTIAGDAVPEVNPALTVAFKISQYSISGIKVDSLAVHVERYKPYKGVRSFTKSGKFSVRC